MTRRQRQALRFGICVAGGAALMGVIGLITWIQVRYPPNGEFILAGVALGVLLILIWCLCDPELK